MKILIVDDENLAISRLKRLLEEMNFKDIVSFNDPLKALEELSNNDFDVVFLDISMPEMSGLEFADNMMQLGLKTFIVFQTAYEQYALDAFKKGGIGYLVKPYEKKDLKVILEKIDSFQSNEEADSKRILGKRGDKLYLIDIDDIFYIKADLDEVIIRIKDVDAYVRRKIGDLELLLKNRNFFRVHRSYIVNVDKIKSMKSIEQSKLQIYFEGIDDIVTSSKDGAKDFREYLEKKIL